MMNLAENAFKSLVELGIIDNEGVILYSYMKFQVPDGSDAMLDFNVDLLGKYDISLAHNKVLNGDVMADPDMQVRIVPESKMAIAYTYQNDYIGFFNTAMKEDGKINTKLALELTAFLNDWLREVIGWGYAPVKKNPKEEDE